MQFESWYELVYVNIKAQKDGLNMNPACSVSLGMSGGDAVLFTTQTHSDPQPLTTWTHELTGCEGNFMRILPFHLRKSASYHTVYIHTETSWQPDK